jgi:lantibiotic transport system ATP-binding protein
MTMAIETDRLTRRFSGKTAVDSVSMLVPKHAIYGFLGCNGAGKSTTLKLLLGLLKADAGSARIDGIDVHTDRLRAARKVGALLETPGFYRHLSGRENLELCRRMLSLPATEIDRVLEITEMFAHRNKRVAHYSQGMLQRLGLARAMLGSPAVVILDEPTNGLDPEGIADMRLFLRELAARTGATVLLSSHLLGEIEQVATHIGILSRGRLVLQGDMAEIRATAAAEVLVGTDTPERALRVARDHGFEVVREREGIVARFSPGEEVGNATVALNRVLSIAGGVRIHALVPRRRTLEALYRQVTEETALPAVF